MRKWRNCTFLSLGGVLTVQSLLSNKKITSASRLKALSKVDTTVFMFQGSRLQKKSIWANSPRIELECGSTRHESSIAKNYLESSSIVKNCLRSSSTWTSGVHRDIESLPNSPKLHSLTRFQPGHQPENWRALQEEEATHGSVSLSSGTSGRCSCRNFGTCIITLMHHRVLYIVMICSGTSVRSARRCRGAKPLAVAAAAIRVGEDVAASQQPSVAAAALFRFLKF